jgi:hypothetical protein
VFGGGGGTITRGRSHHGKTAGSIFFAGTPLREMELREDDPRDTM